MVRSTLVTCSRCGLRVGVRFDHEATPPIYCLKCEPDESQAREKFESDAAKFRAQASR